MKKLPLTLCALLASSLPAHASQIIYSREEATRTILEKAAKSQMIMFGEVHGDITYQPNRHKDSEYVISLLPALYKLGYRYLIVEQNYNHNRLIQHYVRGNAKNRMGKRRSNLEKSLDYMSGRKILAEAGKNGFKVKALDFGNSYSMHTSSSGCYMMNVRDKQTFKNIKREILDKNSTAKIIIFYGFEHIGRKKKRKVKTEWGECEATTLGYYLQNYLTGKGKRFLSVALPLTAKELQDHIKKHETNFDPDIIYPVE